MIYFIRQGDDGPIKIGFTAQSDIKSRIASLQTGSSKPLKLLKKIRGDKEFEKHWHSLFKNYRLTGEWFKPDDYVLSMINLLQDDTASNYDELTKDNISSNPIIQIVREKEDLRTCNNFTFRLPILLMKQVSKICQENEISQASVITALLERFTKEL